MTMASAIRYRDYLHRMQTGKVLPNAIITIHMKRPFRGEIALREAGSDFATFHEITVDEIYGEVVRKVQRFQTVIDLGANIGLASLYLAAHSPYCRILSVEPNPKSYELLVRNVQNLSTRCRTLRAAAWRTHRQLSPAPDLPQDRSSGFRLSADVEGEVIAEGLTMPEILEASGFDTVDLLKIDIEGAEAEIFAGDLGWLTRIGSIAIEFHEDSRTECGFDQIMKNYGFEISSQGKHTVLARKPR
jgi:FkbM family methyltransferase